jgi:hypothetical protein
MTLEIAAACMSWMKAAATFSSQDRVMRAGLLPDDTREHVQGRAKLDETT